MDAAREEYDVPVRIGGGGWRELRVTSCEWWWWWVGSGDDDYKFVFGTLGGGTPAETSGGRRSWCCDGYPAAEDSRVLLAWPTPASGAKGRSSLRLVAFIVEVIKIATPGSSCTGVGGSGGFKFRSCEEFCPRGVLQLERTEIMLQPPPLR